MIREPRPVSSTACGLCLAQRGPLNFDDLHYRQRKYSSFGAYGQSKVANILFAKELAKRCGVCCSCSVFVTVFSGVGRALSFNTSALLPLCCRYPASVSRDLSSVP